MTPEYRKEHLAHCRAYDKLYHATHREQRILESASHHWRNRARHLAQMKAYRAKHRERLRRYDSERLSAEDMIADALA